MLENFRLFGKNTNDLVNQAAKRQNELKDPRLRDDLASARAVLKKNSMMLLTASKVNTTLSKISPFINLKNRILSHFFFFALFYFDILKSEIFM